MTLEERIRSGKLYFCTAPGFAEEQERCLELLYDYNATRPGEKAKRREILSRFFGSVGENLYIEPPLHASFGKNTHWGDNCYANFNLTLVDDGEIRFGDHVMIAPNVVITATGHPVHPELRKKTAHFSIPVRIGSNVWIGSGRRHPARRDDRGQHGHRRGQHRHARHPRRLRGGRQSLPRRARDRRARFQILL